MSNFKLAITVPTRGRPHNLERLAKAVKETCKLEYELFARIDEDDSSVYPELDNVTYVIGPRIFFTASLNELAKIASEQDFTHVAILGDDVLPETIGWDEIMVKSLPELGVAYGSDGLEHLHPPDLPTHVVVPMEMYRRLGWLGMPTSRHLFLDNAWRELGRLTEFIYHPDVKLSHLHRWNKAAPDDKTYREANDKQKREDDRIAFETWRDGDGLQIAKQALSNNNG
jgi:hypothetical protein